MKKVKPMKKQGDVWWVKQWIAITFEPLWLTQSPAYGDVGHEMENLFHDIKLNVCKIDEILQSVAYTRMWPVTINYGRIDWVNYTSDCA